MKLESFCFAETENTENQHCHKLEFFEVAIRCTKLICRGLRSVAKIEKKSIKNFEIFLQRRSCYEG